MDIATTVFNETQAGAAGTPPVRVGIAGVGRTALADHLPALQCLGGLFEVIAVCDLLKPHREEAAKFYPGVRHYRRLDDMFDDPDLEAVLIATESPDHQKQALAASSRNLWTMVETPPAMTAEGAQVLRKEAERTGRLVVSTPFLFTPAYELACKAAADRALGDVFDVRVTRETFLRRDDWQAVERCGGGITRFAALEAVMAARALVGAPPRQLWGELKRVASVGDAEDHARIILKTNTLATADVTVSTAMFGSPDPAFVIRGSRGMFRVEAGAAEGELRAIDPDYKLPRRRSSASTPPLDTPPETFPTVRRAFVATDALSGHARMWRRLHGCIRRHETWPVAFDDVCEAVRLLEVVRRTAGAAK